MDHKAIYTLNMNAEEVATDQESSLESPPRFLSITGLFAGPLLAMGVYCLLLWQAPDLAHAPRATAAIAVLMALWWMTEAIPLEATSLLPLVLLPLCGAVKSFQAAATPYAERSIFLYLGGFMLALAVEKWGLHRRLALLTVLAAGTRPARLVGGVMLATPAISLWVSNTATAVMMLPIGMSVVQLVERRLARGQGADSKDAGSNQDSACFATSLLLGIAYSASIGGMGTLIGTPPNVFFRAFLDEKKVA